MNGFTFAPALGWPLSALIAIALLVMALFGLYSYFKAPAASDAHPGIVIRRSSIALLLAVMVLTPSLAQAPPNRAVNATDVYIAVDVTGSMAVADAQYGSAETLTRLQAASRAVRDITKLYPDASFSAIQFGANSSVDLPLTPDRRAVDNWAQGLRTEPTSLSKGSSLDAPLDQLTLALQSAKNKHPDDTTVVYFISDGEQTSHKSRRSFTTLRADLDDAFCLSVGSTAGGKIPRISDGLEKHTSQEWVTDPTTGQSGISRMNPATLKAIADEMSGHYQAIDKDHTAQSSKSAKVSSDYRVRQAPQRRTRKTAVVWPLALVLLILLVWEMADWVYRSWRLL